MFGKKQGAAELRALLKEDRILVAPGVFDGLSAKIAEAAGFEVLYISGGAISRGMGYPDIGLVTFTEMVKRLEEIRAVTTVPLVVDADTGYGNALNVIRTVQAYERAGAAALHLEDQVAPKRCGHYEGKEIISRQEMVQKIRAAVDARQDPNLIIIARTDARDVAGLDEAIARAHAYAEAGADMIFIESPASREEIERIAREVTEVPLLINMFWGGKTPLVPPADLQAMGYKLMIVPSDLQRAAIRAMQRAAAVLREHGNTATMVDEMASFKEREAVINAAAYKALEDRYLQG